MWKLFILPMFFVVSTVVQAEEIKDGAIAPGDPTDLSNAVTSAFFADKQDSNAFRELNCLRAKAPKGHTFAHCSVENRIKMLAPFLQTGFDKNKMGPKERALFYSQILVESSYLTKFSETSNFAIESCASFDSTNKSAGTGGGVDAGEIAMRDVISEGEDSVKNKSVQGARHSSQFGDFRGRGLIQLTRCDNYLSVLHYLNLQYRGKNPYWQPAWHTGAKQERSNQLGAICTKDELETMMDVYSRQHEGKMSLNLYDAIENPNHFGAPGLDLTDAPNARSPGKADKLNRSLTGEQFMVDVALAYWKGRCGDDIKGWLTHPKTVRSHWCPTTRDSYSENEITSLCAVSCIKGKGSRESWDKRHDWYEKALDCVK